MIVDRVRRRMSLATPDNVKTTLPADSIKNNPAIFNANAIAPFKIIWIGPSLYRFSKGAVPSKTGMQRPIIPAQSYDQLMLSGIY